MNQNVSDGLKYDYIRMHTCCDLIAMNHTLLIGVERYDANIKTALDLF